MGEPWFEGCLTGVGDCAHATRPDLMQGGAMAVEVPHPCCLLAETLQATLIGEKITFFGLDACHLQAVLHTGQASFGGAIH